MRHNGGGRLKMIVKIADKSALECKIMATWFSAPRTEPDYVYFHYQSHTGEDAHFEIDATAILELAEAIKKRKEMKK